LRQHSKHVALTTGELIMSRSHVRTFRHDDAQVRQLGSRGRLGFTRFLFATERAERRRELETGDRRLRADAAFPEEVRGVGEHVERELRSGVRLKATLREQSRRL
jgi:hypothetical protein